MRKWEEGTRKGQGNFKVELCSLSWWWFHDTYIHQNLFKRAFKYVQLIMLIILNSYSNQQQQNHHHSGPFPIDSVSWACTMPVPLVLLKDHCSFKGGSNVQSGWKPLPWCHTGITCPKTTKRAVGNKRRTNRWRSVRMMIEEAQWLKIMTQRTAFMSTRWRLTLLQPAWVPGIEDLKQSCLKYVMEQKMQHSTQNCVEMKIISDLGRH